MRQVSHAERVCAHAPTQGGYSTHVSAVSPVMLERAMDLNNDSLGGQPAAVVQRRAKERHEYPRSTQQPDLLCKAELRNVDPLEAQRRLLPIRTVAVGGELRGEGTQPARQQLLGVESSAVRTARAHELGTERHIACNGAATRACAMRSIW